MNEPIDRDAAVGLVDAYLECCESRDLDAAAQRLGPEPLLVFPGPVRYHSLEAMTARAAERYRWIRKHRDSYAVGEGPSGTVVVSRGRLYGENLYGVPFDDVRYVDVFVVRDGRIHEQHVFNDLAVSGVLDRKV